MRRTHRYLDLLLLAAAIAAPIAISGCSASGRVQVGDQTRRNHSQWNQQSNNQRQDNQKNLQDNHNK